MKKIFSILICAAAVFACKPADKISVDVSQLDFDYSAGMKQVKLAANTEWTAVSDAFITVSPSSGNGDMTVTINVSENETLSPRSGSVTFRGGDAPVVTVAVSQSASVLSFLSFSFESEGSYAGAKGVAIFSTKGAWTIDAPEGVVCSATSGNGDAKVEITAPENEGDEDVVYDIVFKTGSDEKHVTMTVSAPSLDIAGEEYKIKKMPDGKWWMTEPLHYLPEGLEASSDPTVDAHVWYPYAIEGGSPVAKTDAESIKKSGYLYDMYAVLGVDDINAENGASFEGAQGICPDGWHVPTRAEYLALCGTSTKAMDETAAPDNADAFFYDSEMKSGSVLKFNEGGWNFVPSGFRVKATFTATGSYNKLAVAEANTQDQSMTGYPALSYVATSTYYNSKAGSNCQFFALMSTFTAKLPGKLSLAYSHVENGTQVRCVRND